MLFNAWHLEIDCAQARQAAVAGAAGARRLQEAEQAFNVVTFLSMKKCRHRWKNEEIVRVVILSFHKPYFQDMNLISEFKTCLKYDSWNGSELKQFLGDHQTSSLASAQALVAMAEEEASKAKPHTHIYILAHPNTHKVVCNRLKIFTIRFISCKYTRRMS